MDSDPNKEGKRTEETQTVLDAIKERLRPLFLRKYRASRSQARAVATAAGMNPEQVRLYLKGFEQGWLRGAVDSVEVKPSDLDLPDPAGSKDLH